MSKPSRPMQVSRCQYERSRLKLNPEQAIPLGQYAPPARAPKMDGDDVDGELSSSPTAETRTVGQRPLEQASPQGPTRDIPTVSNKSTDGLTDSTFFDVILRPTSSRADPSKGLLQQRPPARIHQPRQAVIHDRIEAEIFQYYIKEAGWWLDIVSPDCHMSRTVPALALDDRLLYSACLAYASHVLYLLGRLDRDTEQHYASTALTLQISKLSEDPHTWSEASVLSATILMRVSEQFSEIGDDQQYHLNGAFSVSASAGRTWSIDRLDLATTAFWTYLRMTIRICFLCERGPNCDMNLIREGDFDINNASETGLTNRITHLLAKVCEMCWGGSTDVINSKRVNQLSTDIEDWRVALPPTFNPWASYHLPDHPFPVLKYLSTWHVIAWQFYYAAKVLLAVHLALLTTPSTVIAQNQYLEREILQPTRQLCAISSSRDEVGTNINGAALMAWCGQYLVDRTEQAVLINWLDKLMSTTKWPNKTCSQRLHRIWAGEQDSWTADIDEHR